MAENDVMTFVIGGFAVLALTALINTNFYHQEKDHLRSVEQIYGRDSARTEARKFLDQPSYDSYSFVEKMAAKEYLAK